jgi:hypothetical protein
MRPTDVSGQHIGPIFRGRRSPHRIYLSRQKPEFTKVYLLLTIMKICNTKDSISNKFSVAEEDL